MTYPLLDRAIDELRRLPCRYMDPNKCEHCAIIRDFELRKTAELALAQEMKEKQK